MRGLPLLSTGRGAKRWLNVALHFLDDEAEDQNGEKFSQDVAASQHLSWRPALKRYFLSHSGECATVETILNTAVCKRKAEWVSSTSDAEALLSWHRDKATDFFMVIVSGPVRSCPPSVLRAVHCEEES